MNKTTPKPTPADRLVEPLSRVLQPNELDQVAGGKVTLSEFSFTKKIDKASPDL